MENSENVFYVQHRTSLKAIWYTVVFTGNIWLRKHNITCREETCMSSISFTFSRVNILLSPTTRNLSFIIDPSLPRESHIHTICKSVFSELSRISRIRLFLSVSGNEKLTSAVVLSRIDYCLSLTVYWTSFRELRIMPLDLSWTKSR